VTDYNLTADWWAEDPDCPSATGWLPGLILRENTAIDLMADLVRRQK